MEVDRANISGQTVRFGVRQGAPGTRPLLVFNGIGANLELLAPFAAAMADEGIGVIAFDIPGVGGSPRPTLPYRFPGLARLAAEFLETLGIKEPVDVLGVSWGGALAQRFAFQHPDQCRRLILAATSAGVVMVPGRLDVLAKMVTPRRYVDSEYMSKVGGELYGGRLREEPELLATHGRHLAPPSGLGYVYQLLAGAGWTSIHWLHRMQQPTLVMMGTDDRIVPVANGRILAHMIPNARLVTVDDGHLFLIARIDEVAPIIRDFLH
ncbi:MAG: poly(3-hydroxyalkanoate) depolymerase [Acetobacteraceae bacterium]|nr:poly(3-hydroxyalkanoate) depolymerase [Acetobacteraceae bacterium]